MFLQKPGDKGLVPLLCEVYAVIGQGDVSLSSVGKADAQLFLQGLTELGKGAGVIHELRAGHPRSQGHRRWGDQQDLASIQGEAGEKLLQPLSGLLRIWALIDCCSPNITIRKFVSAG